MGYLGRRIGLSQDKGDSTPGGADGAVGGGILDLFAQGYFNREGSIYNAPAGQPSSGLIATGGAINDFIDGTDIYRAHVFTNSGTFEVTSTGDFGNNIDFLVVGGGGGGSHSPGPAMGGRGGGGAGGLRTNAAPSFPHNLPSSTMAYPGSGTVSYTVTVGAGGLFGQNNNGTDGGNSSIVHPSLNSGTGIVATGGGYGAYQPGAGGGGPGGGGGSGGGGAYSSSNGGATEASPDGISPTVQGSAGGPGGSNPYGGAGGGGATAAGGAGGGPTAHTAGAGGAGLQVLIAGPAPATTGIGAKNPSNNQYQYFAGGGGGGGGFPGGSGPKGAAGGVGGGGSGADGPQGDDAVAQSGEPGTGGGGGSGSGYIRQSSGNGGSGVVIVKYQIGSTQSSGESPKGATGGAITVYNNKVIHTFVNSGTFVTPGSFSETV